MGDIVQTVGQVVRLGGVFDKKLERAGWFLELAGLALQLGEQVVARYALSRDVRKYLEACQNADFQWEDGTKRTLPRMR